MYTPVLLVALVAAVAVSGQQQYRDPKSAAILTDARYLSGDGTFGASYTQEDGVQFKEETDADGNRRGAYSYVDPSGVRRTVSYTAGKNGFQASGDHLPQAPPAPAGPAPVAAPAYRPQPAAPQYNSPVYSNSGEDTGEYDPRYNDPSFQPNNNQYRPQPQPQYQPQPQQYQPQPQPQQYQPQPQYQQPAYQPNAIPQYNPTTPPPHRFYPPGKLDLNRTPDGFSYSFSKN